MNELVWDASVAIKCVLDEPGSTEARRLADGGGVPIAPELLLAECANVVWKRVHRRLIDPVGAPRLLAAIAALSANLVPLGPLTADALSIALEHDHPVYDCYYIAAAIQNDAALATADERLYELALRVGLGERAILVR